MFATVSSDYVRLGCAVASDDHNPQTARVHQGSILRPLISILCTLTLGQVGSTL